MPTFVRSARPAGINRRALARARGLRALSSGHPSAAGARARRGRAAGRGRAAARARAAEDEARAPAEAGPPTRDVVVLFRKARTAIARVAAQISTSSPPLAIGRCSSRSTCRTLRICSRRSSLCGPRSRLRSAARPWTSRARISRAPRSCSVRCSITRSCSSPGRQIWGVQPVPPLALQLRGWSAVDPSRKRIGMICERGADGARRRGAPRPRAARSRSSPRSRRRIARRSISSSGSRRRSTASGCFRTTRILSPPVLARAAELRGRARPSACSCRTTRCCPGARS